MNGSERSTAASSELKTSVAAPSGACLLRSSMGYVDKSSSAHTIIRPNPHRQIQRALAAAGDCEARAGAWRDVAASSRAAAAATAAQTRAHTNAQATQTHRPAFDKRAA